MTKLGRILVLDVGYTAWLWTVGPVLWAFYFGVPSLAVLPILVVFAVFLVARRFLTSASENHGEDGQLMTTGDVVSATWFVRFYRVAAASSITLAVFSVLVAAGALLAETWVVGVSALFTAAFIFVQGKMHRHAARSVRAIRDLTDGDGKRVLKVVRGKNPRDSALRAYAHLVEGDVDAARRSLAHLDVDGPLFAGTDIVALLEAREGRLRLLQRWVELDPGEHLVMQSRWASVAAHWMLITGIRTPETRVREIGARLPRTHQRQLDGLLARIDDPKAPLDPGYSWQARVYPWLGATTETAVSKADVEALTANAFAPPVEDVVVPETYHGFVGLFPVEWMPIQASGRRSDLIAVAGVLGALGFAFLTPSMLGASVLGGLAALMVLVVLGRYWAGRGALSWVDSRGALAAGGLWPGRVGAWSWMTAARTTGMLLLFGGFVFAATLRVSDPWAPMVWLPLLWGAVVGGWMVAKRTQAMRFAFGASTVPTELEDGLDTLSWTGLGHFLRGDLDAADAAWRASAFPGAGTFRTMLRAREVDPRTIELAASLPVCVLWRRGMLKLLAALLREDWDVVSDDLPRLRERIGAVDSPFADVLIALIDRGQARAAGTSVPPHAVLDALEVFRT